MKIIVVDDNMNIGDLLTEILVEKGYDATFFSRPSEALRSMSETRYDLAILDVRMPEMDGFTLCQRIKADAATSQTRILFVSSHTSEEYVSRAASCGAAGYIDKSLRPEKIIAEIEKLMK